MALPPVDPKEAHEAARTAAEYWNTLSRIIPIMIVGGIVAMVTQLHNIAKEKTWLRRLFICISVVAVGFVSGGVAVLGLSLFLPSPNIELDIVAAAVAGSAGQKTFDIYGRRLFGFKTRSED